MNDPQSADNSSATQSPARRLILQKQAATVFFVSPLLALADTVDADKRQQKRRRRKKRKKDQAPARNVRADATSPGPTTNGFGLTPQGVPAQSFTAGQTELLVRADLRLVHADALSATGNHFLRLAPLLDAIPGPNDLASAQVAGASVGFGSSTITFTLPDPAPIKAGTTHALVLSRDGAGSIDRGTRSRTECDSRRFRPTASAEPLEPRSDVDFICTTFVQS